MKKTIILLITLLMCLLFVGCSKQEETQPVKQEDTTSEEVSVEENKSDASDSETPTEEKDDTTSKKEYNWNVKINGVMYTPENIAEADVDTCIAYVKGVFGENVKYSLKTIGAGWDLFADLDGVVVDAASFGNDCETIRKLCAIWKSGSHISVDFSPYVADACGI